MVATGGSLQKVNIAGRSFHATTDADVGRKLGGFNVSIEANGDGTARKIMVREPWSLEGVVLECDNDRGDQEFLQEVADNPDYQEMSFTTADGITYQASGSVMGDLVYNNQSASMTRGFGGPGKMTPQL